jgi:plastocyanin
MLESILDRRRLRLLLALTVALLACSSAAAIALSGPVAVNDGYFSPKTLTVDKGAKVKWSWAGTLYHNVTRQVRAGEVPLAHPGPRQLQSHLHQTGYVPPVLHAASVHEDEDRRQVALGRAELQSGATRCPPLRRRSAS